MLLPVIRVSTCRASSRPLGYRCTEQVALHLQCVKNGKAVSNGRPDVCCSGMLSRPICACASVANASVKAIEVQSSWVTPGTLLYMCNLDHISVLHAHLMGNSPATRSANPHLVTRLPIRHLLPSRPKPIRAKFVHRERRQGVRPFARDSEQFVLRLRIGQHENAAYFFYPHGITTTLSVRKRGVPSSLDPFTIARSKAASSLNHSAIKSAGTPASSMDSRDMGAGMGTRRQLPFRVPRQEPIAMDSVLRRAAIVLRMLQAITAPTPSSIAGDRSPSPS